jgi:hypothetical protein
MEVQQVISQRDPDTLCAGMEPEFNTMLTYILSSSSKKRPDYRYIKKNLSAIKDRYHFQGILEWFKPDPIPQQISQGGADGSGPINNKHVSATM